MRSQNKLCTMLTTIQRMVFFVSAVLLISESTGMVTTHDVFTRRGDTIRLNCSGVHKNRLWRGPVQTNKAENTVYFVGLQKNPQLTLNNVKLDEDQATKKYNLVISNLTTQNVGVYRCKIPTSQGVTENVFRVSFESVGDANLGTQNTPTGYPAEKQIQNRKVAVLLIVGLGCLILSVTVAIVLARKYSSRILQTKWNAAVCFCLPKEPRHGESPGGESEHGVAVQNDLYYSTHQNVDQRLPRMQLTLSNHAESNPVRGLSPLIQVNQDNPAVNLQHTNGNETKEERFQISERGLNYSEVVHGPGAFTEIRGIADRTIYVEIDHSLKALPLPDETDSDNSSNEETDDDDFVNLRDIETLKHQK